MNMYGKSKPCRTQVRIVEDNNKRLLLTCQEAEQMTNRTKEFMINKETPLLPLLNEVRPFIPEVRILHEFYLYKLTWHYTKSEIHFVQYGLDFTINKYDKHFKISTQFTMPYIDDYTEDRAKESFPVPCRIGVLSNRKIEEWIIYWVQVYNMLKAKNNRNREMIESFRKRIKQENDVQWIGDNGGRIERNGIRFYFEISRTDVNLKMDIASEVSCSLENFLALSDNRYRP